MLRLLNLKCEWVFWYTSLNIWVQLAIYHVLATNPLRLGYLCLFPEFCSPMRHIRNEPVQRTRKKKTIVTLWHNHLWQNLFGCQVLELYNFYSVQQSCNKITLRIKQDLGLSFFIHVQQFTALLGKQSLTNKSSTLAWAEAFQIKMYVTASEREREREQGEGVEVLRKRTWWTFSFFFCRYPKGPINSAFPTRYKWNCRHEILPISFPDDWNE